MKGVDTAHVRTMLQLTHDVGGLDSSAPFPKDIVRCLVELVPCENAIFFEHTPSRSFVVSAGGLEVSAVLSEAVALYGPQRPTAVSRLTPADGVVRLTDRIGRSELGRLDFYREVMRPMGIDDELALRVPATDRGIAGFSLIRSGRFQDRDRDNFALIAPYLAAARERAAGWNAARAEIDLTEREWDVLASVARGRTNKEIARFLLVSPETVRKHLENIYAKLGVHTRTAAVARAFRDCFDGE